MPDVMCQEPPNWSGVNLDEIVLQTICIHDLTKQLLLTTSSAQSSNQIFEDNQSIVRMNTSQDIYTKYPILAYNVGNKKLIFQNTMFSFQTQWVYPLENNERFVSFVEYKDLLNLGFYAGEMRIETASQICFLTLNDENQMYLNLFFIDPYYQPCQIVMFRSSKYFMKRTEEKFKDVVIQSMAFICNVSGEGQKLKLLQQFYQTFVIISMEEGSSVKNEKEAQQNLAKPIDALITEEEQERFDDEEGLSDSDMQWQEIAPIKMIMNNKGQIFYIRYGDGQSQIYEIVPNLYQLKDHLKIYEIKSAICLGFGLSEDHTAFYFIDEIRSINVLRRLKEGKTLYEFSELKLKQKDNADLKLKGGYQKMIISDVCLISEQKIIYFIEDVDFQDGILDMENMEKKATLTQNEIYKHGPFKFNGCDEFFIVLFDMNSYSIIARVYTHPDAYHICLVADYEKQCEFTTFISSGEIMLKIKDRFLIFDEHGNFIYQVMFYHHSKDEQLEKEKKKFNQYQKMRSKRNADYNNEKMEEQKYIQKYLEDITANLESNMEGGSLEYEPPQLSDHEIFEGGNENQTLGNSTMVEMETINYTEDEEEEKEKIGKWNQMKLIKMSRNNQCFLFEDKIDKVLRVYRLCQIPSKSSDLLQPMKSTTEDRHHSHKNQNRMFVFYPLYEIDILKMKMMRNFFFQNNNITYKAIMDKLQACGQINIDDNGGIGITLNTFELKNENANKLQIHGSVLTRSKSLKTNLFSQFDEHVIQQDIEFEQQCLKDIIELKKKQINEQENLYNIEKAEQEYLSEKEKDDSKLIEMNFRIKALKLSLRNTVTQQIIQNEVLVVFSGRIIKYALISQEWLEQIKREPLHFTNVNIHFSRLTEVLKVLSTCHKNEIQIVAHDLEHQLILVITWDIELNMEVSFFQIKINEGENPEKYICRGMHLRRNYYVSKDMIYDLSNNIPTQTVHTENTLPRGGKHVDEDSQRKIWKNNTRLLSICKPNVLEMPLNRKDYLLWKNIEDMGDKPEILDEYIKLEQYGTVFNGQSLFHHYVHRPEMIEVIFNNYQKMKNNNLLSQREMYMPLVCLSPNHAGKTALELAQELKIPKSFALMMTLLSQFNDFCINKMLISQLISLVETSIADNFLDNSWVQPFSLIEPITIRYLMNDSELLFTCHTSQISEEIIISKLMEKKGMKPNMDQIKANAHNPNDKEEIHNCQGPIVPRRNYIFSGQDESDNHNHNDSDKDETITRVSVQLIDLDWLFAGDNVLMLLKTLIFKGRISIFKTKAIRSFIQMLWNHYQPAIIKKIFMPYCMYMVTQVMLTTGFAGTYFKILARLNDTESSSKLTEEDKQKLIEEKDFLAFIINCITVIAILLWLFFFLIECKQMMKNVKEYILDFSNWLDMTSQIVSLSFFLVLDYCILFDTMVVDIQALRIWGGTASMLMWMRMFQWMRLFKETAHFITLLSTILKDLATFNFMFLIVMCAFGNFYLVMDSNTPQDNDIFYVGKYSNFPIVDSLIQMYLISMGEFQLDSFVQGPNYYVMWPVFIICSYTLNVIFLNLIIAIISETYQNIQSRKEEIGLMSQAQVIHKIFWILDPKKLFKGQKYIVFVEERTTIQNEEFDVGTYLNQMEVSILQRSDVSLERMIRRIDNFDQSSRQEAKSVYNQVINNRESIMKYEKSLNDFMDRLVTLKDDDLNNFIQGVKENMFKDKKSGVNLSRNYTKRSRPDNASVCVGSTAKRAESVGENAEDNDSYGQYLVGDFENDQEYDFREFRRNYYKNSQQ